MINSPTVYIINCHDRQTGIKKGLGSSHSPLSLFKYHSFSHCLRCLCKGCNRKNWKDGHLNLWTQQFVHATTSLTCESDVKAVRKCIFKLVKYSFITSIITIYPGLLSPSPSFLTYRCYSSPDSQCFLGAELACASIIHFKESQYLF